MKKIFIWGTGKRAEEVFDSLVEEKYLIGFIDSDKRKQNTLWHEKYNIFSPEEAMKKNYGFIIISPREYESILYFCEENNIPNDKVIIYEKLEESNSLIDIRNKKIRILENKCTIYEARLENKKYELGIGEFPIILPAEELLKEIIKKKKSLIRFGDGELEIMCKRERASFQTVNEELVNRLNQVFLSDRENCLIAVANNFGNLDCYTEDGADGIRLYLQGKRTELVNLIGTTRKFYDAYVSRSYLIFKDKEYACKIFDLYKRIWHNRNVIVVEGIYTRTGINNGLFNGAKRVRRILCPAFNAFDKYEQILDSVKKSASLEDLILITLGPTATVLAYDLSCLGYQAIDLGQVDNEYEWYLRKVTKRVYIPGKSVSEIPGYREIEEINSKEYEEQIICKIM